MSPNPLARAAAGRIAEFLEIIQVGASHKSGSARLWGRSASVRFLTFIPFCTVVVAMSVIRSFAIEQPEPYFFSRETNAIIVGHMVFAAVRDGDAHSKTNIQPFFGQSAVFIGGTVPHGKNADLTLGDGITLKVEINPFKDVRPMSVLWESEVLGTLDSVDFTHRIIRITSSSDNWKIRQTW